MIYVFNRIAVPMIAFRHLCICIFVLYSKFPSPLVDWDSVSVKN